MKNHNQNTNLLKNKKSETTVTYSKIQKTTVSKNDNNEKDIKKKKNISPQKNIETKKDSIHKTEKNTSNSESKEANNNYLISNKNLIQNNNNNYMYSFGSKKDEDIPSESNKKNTNTISNINIKESRINTNNIINNNEFTKNIKINSPKFSDKDELFMPNDDEFASQLKDSDKKLHEALQSYNNTFKKNDGGVSINTLYKLRNILINWLKDSDQDLEYTKFITEKKLKYLVKNKEKTEMKIKILDNELKGIMVRKEELEKILGDLYSSYDEEGLKDDIKRFENSYEIKSGKFSKTLQQLEEMKKMLPYVIEYDKIKESKNKKYNEKKEMERFVKGTNQTLIFLNNYYKNIKKKINEQINNNNNV